MEDNDSQETHGRHSPASWVAAEAHYEQLGSTAQVVVRAVAKAMSFDREEYESRVTGSVTEAARQALFAESLTVHTATKAEFDAWRSEYPHDVRVAGSETVGNVAWHVAPVAETAVAATFENEPEAAIGTVRRMAFNRLYRDTLTGATQ